MSACIVDASVVAKWFLDEAFSDQACRVLTAGTVAAPDFLLLEMDSVFSKRIRLGEWTVAYASLNRRLLRRLPIRLFPADELYDLAFGIAAGTRQSVYDCLYLALAVQVARPLVTADRRFFENIAAGPLRTHVRWVGDLPGGA